MRRTALLVLILIFGQLAGVVYAGLAVRPTKTCGTTTYDSEVAAGCTTIKSTEVDADLNVLVNSVNNLESSQCSAAGFDTQCYADGSITGTKIAAGTVTSGNIADGTIVNADVAAGAAIVGTKLADAPSGVPTVKINDAAITTAKIAVGDTVRVRVGANVSTALAIGPGTETTIVSVITTTFGGDVFMLGAASVQWTTIGGGSGTATVRYKVDGGTTRTLDYNLLHDGAETTLIPIGSANFLNVAGVHTYDITVELVGGSAGIIGTPAANAGNFQIYEPA